MGGDVDGRRVAILGIAFKADTDDIRDSAALSLIPELRGRGASIAAYDPQAGAAGAARHRRTSYGAGTPTRRPRAPMRSSS